MLDWTLHIKGILGTDPHKKAEGQAQVDELLTLRAMLSDSRLQAEDRVRLISWIADLDDVRQVFLLPGLVRLLADPSRIVRKRLFELLEQIAVDDTALRGVLSQLAAFVEVDSPTPQKLKELLGEFETLLLGDADFDLKMPLSALQFLRHPIFVLSMLTGLNGVLAVRPAATRLKETWEAFFDEEARAPLQARLRQWLAEGPMFLRYMVVWLIAETGISTTDGQAAQLLLHSYRNDGDPLVASAAIEAYARQVKADEVKDALTLLSQERLGFARRPLRFDWEFSGVEHADKLAVRMLSVSVLSAIGILALEHISDPRPQEALCQILTTHTPQPLLLDLSDRTVPMDVRERVFRIAVLLHGSGIWVRVAVARPRMIAEAGLAKSLNILDPDQLLRRHPAASHFFAEPVLNEQAPNEPIRWNYCLRAVFGPRHGQVASDLSQAVSPVLACFFEERPTQFSLELQSRVHSEIEERGDYMAVACDAVAAIVEKSIKQQDALVKSPLDDFLCYLIEMGLGVTVTHRDKPTAIRRRLRNKVKSLFLNLLPHEAVFKKLVPEGRPGHLEAQFLGELADSSLRSLPGTPTRRWLDENICTLIRILSSPGYHVKVRAPAAVALSYGAGSQERVHEALAAFRPAFHDVFYQVPTALRFVSDEELEHYYTAQALGDAAAMIAIGNQRPHDYRQFFVYGEILARCLEKNQVQSGLAERCAAACIGAGTKANSHVRLRLLQAYASYRLQLSNNVLRLLHQLLRHATSAELALYLSCRAGVTPDPLPASASSQLVSSLQDAEEGRRRGNYRIDQMAIADRLARRRIVLSLLAKEAVKSRDDFFRIYREQREPLRKPRKTETLTAAVGEVLRAERVSGAAPEFLSILRGTPQPGAVLAEKAGDITPAFVHFLPSDFELHCLAHFHPVPLGTLDLHARKVSDERKSELLQQKLLAGPTLLLSRVVMALTNSTYLVDLGASTAELLRRQEIVTSKLLHPDDAVLVEVSRKERTCLQLVGGRFIVPSPVPNYVTEDLRQRPNALDELRQIEQKRPNHRYLLAATVVSAEPYDPTHVCYQIEMGIRQRSVNGQDVYPVAVVPLREAREVGTRISVSSRDLVFAEQRQALFTLTPRDVGALDQSTLFGSVVSERRSCTAARRWFGLCGKLKLPISRRKLTGDLGTLYALDAVPDGHPILASLANATLPLRVVDGGRAFSLLDAASYWQVEDLLLAVLSGAATTITFIGAKPKANTLTFEVHLRGDYQFGPRRLGMVPLGTLAQITEGELYDVEGEPVLHEFLREGLRLSLEVVWEHPQLGVALSFAEIEKHPELAATPRLRVREAPDNTNVLFVSNFETERPLRIRVIDRPNERSLKLADPLPIGYSAPSVFFEDGNDASVQPDAEYDFVVKRATHPSESDFQVWVARPRTQRVILSSRHAKKEMRALFDLRSGAIFPGRKQILRNRSCLVMGIKIKIDSLTKYLLPRLEMDSGYKAIESALDGVDVLLTRVKRFRAKAIQISGSEIPYLKQKAQAVGVVVGIPRTGESGPRRVEVRWLSDEPRSYDADPEIASENWDFDPGGYSYWNGDLIRAEDTNDGLKMSHEARRLECSLIHNVMSFASWVETHGRAYSEGQLRGTFIQREADRFLLVLEPTCLVAVPEHALQNPKFFDDVYPLDRVDFQLSLPAHSRKTDSAPALLRAENLLESVFRKALQQPCVLDVLWDDSAKKTYQCNLKLRGADVSSGLEDLYLAQGALTPQQCKMIASQKKPYSLNCTFHGYVLNVHPVKRADRNESVLISFEPQLSDRSTSRQESKPQLAAALVEQAGRLDDVTGKVVEIGRGADGEPELGVQFERYVHDQPVPLPADEQTWVRHTGFYVERDWRGKFSVVIGNDGKPLASLRLRRPLPLERWIEHMRLGQRRGMIDGHRLFYFGELSEAQRRDCGLSEPASAEVETAQSVVDDEPLVLFEVAAGLSFTARPSQLRFFGEPWAVDLSSLQVGDIIERFCLFLMDEGGERGLDLRQVTPDVRLEIESFAEKRGIFYGSLRWNTRNEAELVELLGLHNQPAKLSAQRRARWKLTLEPIDANLRGRLKTLEEGDYAYFKFVRADAEAGVLYFRVLRPEEAFAKSNLVYVRANAVSHYGNRGLKLDVQPLNQLGDSKWSYFIPETLYSERLGWLNTSSRTQNGTFLAKVQETDLEKNPPEIKLSLRHNPYRSFTLLLRHGTGQVIVKSTLQSKSAGSVAKIEKLFVEYSEGVNVELPIGRLELGAAADTHSLQPGDVLSFAATSGSSRIVITDVRRSHRSYLQGSMPKTVLTRLWATPSARRKKVESHAPLNCSLVGLPQLKGLCSPRDAHVELMTAFPQIVTNPNDLEWIHLAERFESTVFTGMLKVNNKGQAELYGETGHSLPLRFSSITFFEAPFSQLATRMMQLRFYNTAIIHVNDPQDTLQTTPVVAWMDELRQPMLTEMARWPYPVEHLVEQYPPRRMLPREGVPHLREFVVAQADKQRLILEIAPGRFAELPISLLLPLHHTSLREGLRFDFTGLSPGDALTLELVTGSEGAEEFIPRFRIHLVRFGYRRHLEAAFTLPVWKAADGTPHVGMAGGPQFAAPLLEDRIIDLVCVPAPDRSKVLREQFMRYGSRLLLRGEVTGTEPQDLGVRYFIDIGLRVPINRREGRNEVSNPSWLTQPSEPPPPRQTVVQLRVLDAVFEGPANKTTLTQFHYRVETVTTEQQQLVHNGRDGLRHQRDLLQPGDAVMVYKSVERECGIVGFPNMAVSFALDEEDALRLHDSEQRRLVLSKLLREPDSFIWATVDAVDHAQRTIVLSRRMQLARNLPAPGAVVLARIIDAISQSRVLIDLGGLPWVLWTGDLGYGAPPLRELCEPGAKHSGLRDTTLEVVRQTDGSLSARAVYEDLPTRVELEAVIEQPSSTGLLVVAQGRRIFVPKSELALCELNAQQIEHLFPPGYRILIYVADEKSRTFSHIRTHAIRTEFASFIRQPREPIYVWLALTDEPNARVFVRGRSQVVMSLQLLEGHTVNQRFCAYVRRLDTRHHQLELSMDEPPVQEWNLLPTTSFRKDEWQSFAVDRFSDEVIKASLEELQTLIPAGGGTAVRAWSKRQQRLSPSPRNLRLLLERLHAAFGNSTEWADRNAEPTTAVDGGPSASFGEIFDQISGVLTGRLPVVDAQSISRFAIGYWLLLVGQETNAEQHLRVAWDDANLRPHLDVLLSAAYLSFNSRQGDLRDATMMLRMLAGRLFASALRTLMPPLLEPELAGSVHEERTAFISARAAGDLEALENLLIRKLGAATPNSVRTRNNVVWFHIAQGQYGPSFDSAVAAFFDALAEEQSIDLPIDPRLYCMAALLSFGRGAVSDGLYYLEQVEETPHPEVRIARFWRAWLLDEQFATSATPHSALGRLLEALLQIWRQCRWQDEIAREAFHNLWRAFRSAAVHWILDIPGCRSLPEPPEEQASLHRWASEFGAEVTLATLYAERGLADTVS